MRIRAQSLDAVRSLGTVSPLSISVLLRPRPSLRAGVTEARSSAPTRPEATRVAASALLGIREDSPSRCMTRCMRVAQNARLKRLCLRATSRRTRTWAHDAATSTKEDIVTTENTSSGTTAALVIVESYFGSTRTIAEAIAAGLSETGAQARVLDQAGLPVYENLFAAGGILAGAVRWREYSGEGIAAASALRAAEGALA